MFPPVIVFQTNVLALREKINCNLRETKKKQNRMVSAKKLIAKFSEWDKSSSGKRK
jgi:hypothetical protein